MIKKEKVDLLFQFLRSGLNISDSCEMAGISRETFYKWQKKDLDFAKKTAKAELECKARNIAIIQKAAEKSWQAGAWWLERKHNTEFALKQINELQGQNGGPIQINYIDPEGLSRLIKSNAAPVEGLIEPAEIPGTDLAQKSKEDINSVGEGSVGST